VQGSRIYNALVSGDLTYRSFSEGGLEEVTIAPVSFVFVRRRENTTNILAALARLRRIWVDIFGIATQGVARGLALPWAVIFRPYRAFCQGSIRLCGSYSDGQK
jgi:hypothetical protein